MRTLITSSILSLAIFCDAAEVLLFENSPVCRLSSLTARMNVLGYPGGACNPIPDTRVYTSATLGQSGPNMRLRIYTYQGTPTSNQCGGNIGDGTAASSCVTADGQLKLITGVGVRVLAASGHTDDATVMEGTGLVEDPGIVAYGYADGKILHEIHRDSAHAEGYLKLEGDKERASYILKHADYRRQFENWPIEAEGKTEL